MCHVCYKCRTGCKEWEYAGLGFKLGHHVPFVYSIYFSVGSWNNMVQEIPQENRSFKYEKRADKS